MSKEQKPNSISFGPVNYDESKHLVQGQGSIGGNNITCSVTEDALKEVFHVKGGEKEYMQSFKQHEKEIGQAAMQKIQAQQWQVPNKEILLDQKDLREYK